MTVHNEQNLHAVLKVTVTAGPQQSTDQNSGAWHFNSLTTSLPHLCPFGRLHSGIPWQRWHKQWWGWNRGLRPSVGCHHPMASISASAPLIPSLLPRMLPQAPHYCQPHQCHNCLCCWQGCTQHGPRWGSCWPYQAFPPQGQTCPSPNCVCVLLQTARFLVIAASEASQKHMRTLRPSSPNCTLLGLSAANRYGCVKITFYKCIT